VIDPVSVDFPQLLAEIQQEVDRRRAAGDLPPDFEQELERTFSTFAPVDAIDGDFDSLLARIERSAAIDTQPSMVSARPTVARIKKFIAKAVGFYVRHIASQVSSLIQAVAKALRLLSDRVDRIEQDSPQLRKDLWGQFQHFISARAAALPPEEWDETILDALQGVRGRVLHAEAGDGRLVSRLRQAGLDAYGVEPVEEVALLASDRFPDIRADDITSHLRILPAQSLHGLILTGCVERLPVGQLIDLVELAVSRLVPGCVLVLVSIHPAAWARGVSPVAADLAYGHPLYPETWQALLETAGFCGVQIHLGDPRHRLPEVPGQSVSARVTNANFARLSEALMGSSAYAVTAASSR
jgi:hypothetical protein